MLPIEIELAISDKIDVLMDMAVINSDIEEEIRDHMREVILAEPDRDPYVIMDQIAHTYINRAWD